MSLDRCSTSIGSITLGLALALGGCAAQTQPDPPAPGTEEQATQSGDEHVGTSSSEIIIAPGYGGYGGFYGAAPYGYGYGLGCGAVGYGACGAGYAYGVAAPVGCGLGYGYGYARAYGYGLGYGGACGGIRSCVW